jgi:hypothetical protein
MYQWVSRVGIWTTVLPSSRDWNLPSRGFANFYAGCVWVAVGIGVGHLDSDAALGAAQSDICLVTFQALGSSSPGAPSKDSRHMLSL